MNFSKNAVILSVGLIIAVLLGCSHRARRNLLSIFLDGVPVPEESAPETTTGESQEVVASTSSTEAHPAARPPHPAVSALQGEGNVLHSPYEMKACAACHDMEAGAGAGLQFPPPALCFMCHDRVDQLGEVIHWPVQQGQCLFCHDPHRSRYAKLLKNPQPQLCFQCHNKDLLAHGAEVGVCTDCHNPHSSESAGLMKE